MPRCGSVSTVFCACVFVFWFLHSCSAGCFECLALSQVAKLQSQLQRVERALQATSSRLRQTHDQAGADRQRAQSLAEDLDTTRKQYESALGELTEQVVVLSERLRQQQQQHQQQLQQQQTQQQDAPSAQQQGGAGAGAASPAVGNPSAARRPPRPRDR